MKKTLLFIILFLISILTISGCMQKSYSLKRCLNDSDCQKGEYCYISLLEKDGFCKPTSQILNNTMVEGCIYGVAFEDEFNNIFCFANNSLQHGYFGTINLDPLGEDDASWKPRLLNNDFTVFQSYGSPQPYFENDTIGRCLYPNTAIGGYDTVILNDGNLHLPRYDCNGGGSPEGRGGVSIWDKTGNKIVAISLNEVYNDAKYQNLHQHHSIWPLQNGNFFIMGGHKIYFDDAISLGKNSDLAGFRQEDEFGLYIDSGFFIEVRPAKPEDNDGGCIYDENQDHNSDDNSGYWKCISYIEYEWYMADNFVQDYNTDNEPCSNYRYKDEPTGCYAISSCTDSDRLPLLYNDEQSCNDNADLEGNTNSGIWDSEIYKYPHMIDINLPSETPTMMGVLDWAHLNTIHWTPSITEGGFCPENDGCVIISSRSLGDGEMYIIGKTSNQIIYRCCNPDNYGRGISAGGDSYERITALQHGGNWIPPGYEGAGNIIWMNNGHSIVPCSDIETEEECGMCTSFESIRDPNNDQSSLSSCKWSQGGGYCYENPYESWMSGYCANSAVVEIKPNYYIEQNSFDPFKFDEIYIMDRVYGSAPYYYFEEEEDEYWYATYPDDCEEGYDGICTIDTNNYANKFFTRFEGGVFKLPNGNVFISHEVYAPKYEVGDPYGVPELLSMIGGDPVITEPRIYKIIPTCTDPSALNYDPASIYMYHIDDGSCIYLGEL